MEEFIDNGLRVRSIEGSEVHFIREDGIKILKRKNGSLAYGKGSLHRSGYMRISLGGGKQDTTHRVVAKAFLPNPDNYPMVDHIDNDGSNNHVSNLRWCTNKQNLDFYHQEQKSLKPKTEEAKDALISSLIQSLNEALNAQVQPTIELEMEIARLREKNLNLSETVEKLDKAYTDAVIGNGADKTINNTLNITTVVCVNKVFYKNKYEAARHIVSEEELLGNSKNIETVQKEIKKFLQSDRDTREMYGRYIITRG